MKALLVGCFDSKNDEFEYVYDHLKKKVQVVTLNLGANLPSPLRFPVDYDKKDFVGDHKEEFSDKAALLREISEGARRFIPSLCQQNNILTIVGMGGSCGTSLFLDSVVDVPLSVSKICLSTIAGTPSCNVAGTGIVVLPALVDVAGLNILSRRQMDQLVSVTHTLTTTAATQSKQSSLGDRPIILITMFGNSTPCVDYCRKMLEEEGYEPVIFHAVGSGGQAMERILKDNKGEIAGILDLTLTEWADEICQGEMSAGHQRLDQVMESGLPVVLAPGCVDMANFSNLGRVPEVFKSVAPILVGGEGGLIKEEGLGEGGARVFLAWNSLVTLMRTNAEENKKMGEIFANKVNKSKGPTVFLFPEKGFSILGGENGPFCDFETDKKLFSSFKEHLLPEKATVLSLKENINSKIFAEKCVSTLFSLLGDKHPPPPPSCSSPPANLPKTLSVKGHFRVASEDTFRGQYLKKLRENVKQGRPIIGAGAGTGISAKFEEKGGADLLVIYNSGRFRMAGQGSLAGLLSFCDANAVMLEMSKEVLAAVKDVPVLAGVNATDPFKDMKRLCEKIQRKGMRGVQNFPTVGLIDGLFRANLEETNLSYSKEIEMIGIANSLDLITTPYVFDPEQAVHMCQVGADILVAHMGLTTSGTIGAKTSVGLPECAQRIQEIVDNAREIRPDIIVLCHGGAIANPEDAEYIFNNTTGVSGFYGASSCERLPVEGAITNQMEKFTNLALGSQ